MKLDRKKISTILRKGDPIAYQKAAMALDKQFRSMLVTSLQKRYHLQKVEALERYYEALAILIRDIQAEKDIRDWGAYLWGIAQYKVWEARKKVIKERGKKERFKNEVLLAENPDTNLMGATCAGLYQKQIRPHLGMPCSDLLLLRAKGYSYHEIAGELMLVGKNPESNARKQYQRCKDKLLKIIRTNPNLKHTLHELFT